MSQHLIQHYLNSLHDLRKVSGTHRESVVRERNRHQSWRQRAGVGRLYSLNLLK